MEKENQLTEINLIDSIVDIIKTIIKHKKIIFICFILNLGLSIAYLILKKPVFKTEMIISSPVVTSERISFFIDPLGKLVEEENFEELSRLLNISIPAASSIKGIEAKELKDDLKSSKSENYNSEVLRQQNCLVSVKIKNNPLLSDTIQKGIVTFLRKNDFIKRSTESEKTNLINLKNRIRHEIAELDSLKIKVSYAVGQIGLMDPSSINNSIANLYQQELGIDLKLKLDDGGVNIIRDFARYKSPIEPKRNLVLLLTLISSLITSYLAVIFISVRNKLKKNN